MRTLYEGNIRDNEGYNFMFHSEHSNYQSIYRSAPSFLSPRTVGLGLEISTLEFLQAVGFKLIIDRLHQGQKLTYLGLVSEHRAEGLVPLVRCHYLCWEQ